MHYLAIGNTQRNFKEHIKHNTPVARGDHVGKSPFGHERVSPVKAHTLRIDAQPSISECPMTGNEQLLFLAP